MPRDFPLNKIAYLHRYASTERSGSNAPIKAWIPPKEQLGTPVRVINWAPLGPSYETEDEPVSKIELYVPPKLHTQDFEGNWTVEVPQPAPKDVIDLPGPDGVQHYDVVGHPRDYTQGFHGWEPGLVIDITRQS